MQKKRVAPLTGWAVAIACVFSLTASDCRISRTDRAEVDCTTRFNRILQNPAEGTVSNLNGVTGDCMKSFRELDNPFTKEQFGAVAAMAATASASKAISDTFGLDLGFDASLPSRNSGNWLSLSPLERVLIHGGTDPLFRMQNPLRAEDALPMNIIGTLNDSSDPTSRAYPDSPTPAQVKQALIAALGVIDSIEPYLSSPIYSSPFVSIYDTRSGVNVNYGTTEIQNVRANAAMMAYILQLFDLYEFDTSTAPGIDQTLEAAGVGAGSQLLRTFNPSPYSDLSTARGSAAKAKLNLGRAFESYRSSSTDYAQRGAIGFLIAPGALTSSQVTANIDSYVGLDDLASGTSVRMEVRSDDQTQTATVNRFVSVNEWLDNLPSSLVRPTMTVQVSDAGADRLRIDVFGSTNTTEDLSFIYRFMGMLEDPLPAHLFRTTSRTVRKQQTLYDASRIIWDDMFPDVKYTLE